MWLYYDKKPSEAFAFERSSFQSGYVFLLAAFSDSYDASSSSGHSTTSPRISA